MLGIYQELFFILVMSGLCWKLYLTNRQISTIKDNINSVPNYFDKLFTVLEHQKGANYNLMLLKLSAVSDIVYAVTIIILTIGGGLHKIMQFTHNDILLILIFGAINFLIHLPLELYKTFYIERKFKFNTMTWKLFIVDKIKQIILSLIILVPLLYVILHIMHIHLWWIWSWIIIVTFNIIIALIYPTLIAPIFNKFTTLNDATLLNKIIDLLTKCKFKSSGIFVVDGSKRSTHSNAYFTGFGKTKRIVLFDTLINQLSHEEIIAVLAHELGHFKHKHIIQQILINFTIIGIGMLLMYQLIDQPMFYNALGVHVINHGAGVVLFQMLSSLIILPITPIINYISRYNEFTADKFACLHANKQNLINGLIKLYKNNATTLVSDWLYAMFHDSHPTAATRIAKLEQ